MKFLATTIFIFLLLLQTFSKWLMVVDYTINREYIAENLCENRSKPKLHCNGKCQLIKNMAEEDQNNKTSAGGSITKISFSEFSSTDNLMPSTDSSSAIKSVYNHFYLMQKTTSYSLSVFHPPLF